MLDLAKRKLLAVLLGAAVGALTALNVPLPAVQSKLSELCLKIATTDRLSSD